MIIHKDSLEWLKEQEADSIDHIITDPPYLIDFMNKGWDSEDNVAGSKEYWEQALRVCKAGSYALVFGHSRTHHRVMVAMEDAGWEIRDTIMWLYGEGFPKSHNIGKSVQKKLGNVKVIGKKKGAGTTGATYISGKEEYKDGNKGVYKKEYNDIEITNEWKGWGSCLKPAYEPIILARKPFDGSLSDNIILNGLGGLNIDACRVRAEDKAKFPVGEYTTDTSVGKIRPTNRTEDTNPEGRFPANVILSHNPECKLVGETTETIIGGNKGKSGFAEGYTSGDFTKKESPIDIYECEDDCPIKLLDTQAPKTGNGHKPKAKITGYGKRYGGTETYDGAGERVDGLGGASRFFYCAKVKSKERDLGCEELEDKPSQLNSGGLGRKISVDKRIEKHGTNTPTAKNTHPTIKPIKLMEYLVKLVSKEGQTILDPFAGSGSTGLACKNLKRNYILVEREDEYIPIIRARVGEKENKDT